MKGEGMRHVDAVNEGREGDVGKLLNEVGDWVATLTETMREAGEQTVQGTDPGEQVTAKVSGAGRLLGLTIDARAMRDLDHLALAEAVMQSIAAARIASGERLTEALQTMGGGPPAAKPGGDPLEPYITSLLREG